MEYNSIHGKGIDQSDCPFPPGDMVSDSGLYEICHYDDEPRSRVILTVRGVFPQCRRCGDKVRYKLLERVPHISEDPDFNEFFTGPYNPALDSSAPTQAFPMQLGQAHGFRFWQNTLQTWRYGPESRDL